LIWLIVSTYHIEYFLGKLESETKRMAGREAFIQINDYNLFNYNVRRTELSYQSSDTNYEINNDKIPPILKREMIDYPLSTSFLLASLIKI